METSPHTSQIHSTLWRCHLTTIPSHGDSILYWYLPRLHQLRYTLICAHKLISTPDWLIKMPLYNSILVDTLPYIDNHLMNTSPHNLHLTQTLIHRHTNSQRRHLIRTLPRRDTISYINVISGRYHLKRGHHPTHRHITATSQQVARRRHWQRRYRRRSRAETPTEGEASRTAPTQRQLVRRSTQREIQTCNIPTTPYYMKGAVTRILTYIRIRFDSTDYSHTFNI